MLRKMIVGIAAAATITGAVALSATEASARHGFGGGGFRGGGHFAFHGGGFRGRGFRVAHFGGFHRFGRFHHFGFRRARFFGGPIYAYGYGGGCWQWVPTYWGGLRRVWVC
jgi:hypothetical protein